MGWKIRSSFSMQGGSQIDDRYRSSPSKFAENKCIAGDISPL